MGPIRQAKNIDPVLTTLARLQGAATLAARAVDLAGPDVAIVPRPQPLLKVGIAFARGLEPEAARSRLLLVVFNRLPRSVQYVWRGGLLARRRRGLPC